MTPEDFTKIAHKIYGRKKWKAQLARDLGVDPVTVYRITKRPQVPGPYEVALNGLMEHRRKEIALEKEARKLMPRKFRKRSAVRKPRLIKAAGT